MGLTVAPPRARAQAAMISVIHVSVFMGSPLRSQRLDELAHDRGDRAFGLAALIVGRLPALAVRNHDQRGSPRISCGSRPVSAISASMRRRGGSTTGRPSVHPLR